MSNRQGTLGEDTTQGKTVFMEDPLTEALRSKVAEWVQTILQEEIDAALGAGFYQRVNQRSGYRHGSESRTLSTSLGPTSFACPRARLLREDGSTTEWQSEVLPRYQRRAKALDDALIGIYLSGTNTRRIKRALAPLLEGTPLSKSVISRLVQRLQEAFEAWKTRSWVGETFVYIYADAIRIRVRAAGRVVKLPVLVVIGVRETGQKELLVLDMRGSESQEAWTDVLRDLVNRGLNRPQLVIADGNDGLLNAIETLWPGVDIQRCTVHKLRNLLSYAPKHAQEEIKRDYHDIVRAAGESQARVAYEAFVRKYSKRLERVARSLEEAGPQLLTFFKYPKSQWRSLHSTNVIERINEEFRRRVKTQASFPTERAVLIVLFGLYASGQIRMQRLVGYKDLPEVMKKSLSQVA